MGPPVRVVCLDCLESIEVSGSGSTSQPEHCPHCGSYLDPFDQGIQSRAILNVDSPPTLDLSDASTLRSDNEIVRPLRTVGRFEIKVVLGEGGYGQVFRAFDPHLEREVALKVLKPNRLGEKALQRFYREARAAARLDHPNIVALHDAGRDDGRCWIAYQLVSGRTLSAVRDIARPSVLDSIRIVRDLALGLHHAHGRGVFHRDLKPANVMIDDAGRPRLTDFGLARRGDVESDLTTEGTVLGTPQYMSPEAAAGRAHEADARSDVYSLGVILYELLCGKRPCDLPSGAPLWRSLHRVNPPTPRSVDRAIPPSLDRICMKALALNPDDRYSNAELLADALTDQITKYRPPRSSKRSIERIAEIARPRFRHFDKLAIASSLCLLAVAAALLLVRPKPAASPLGPAGPPANLQVEVEPPAPNGPLPMYPDSVIKPPPSEEAEQSADKVAELGDLAPSLPALELEKATEDRPALTPFLGNKESKTYHLANRKCAAKIKKRVDFRSVAEAAAGGYRPCGICHPDLHEVVAPGVAR